MNYINIAQNRVGHMRYSEIVREMTFALNCTKCCFSRKKFAFRSAKIAQKFCERKSYKCQHWLHYYNYMHNILSRLMGVSALKTVFRNIENSLKNWQNPLEKQEFSHYSLVNISEHTQYFRNRICANRFVFKLKIQLYFKNPR